MEKIALKKIITHSNKSLIYLIMTGIFLTLYLGSGAISYQHGVILPMPNFETEIPFLTWTIWIYIVLYPLYILWSLYNYQQLEYMNKTFYSFLFMTIFACFCFILFPVTYPREFFPLPFNDDFSTLIFRLMRKADKPSNCLPSLHVALCFLFCYGFRFENKYKYFFSFFISIIVSISTLTTKQHYIYDIVTGLALATFIHLFFHHFTMIKQKS